VLLPEMKPFMKFRALIVLGLCFLLASCNVKNRPLKWTEEVNLPDNRIIQLTRYQEFKGPHELGDTPSVSDYWFEFQHPDTAEKIRWESGRELTTLALVFVNRVTYLLTKPDFGGVERFECPDPPYLLFAYLENKWERVPLSKMPVKKLRVNMTYDPDSERDKIRRGTNHLTAFVTSDSKFNGRPFIINFGAMPEQTFGYKNCGKTFKRYIESE
jgi:hypothetical protein